MEVYYLKSEYDKMKKDRDYRIDRCNYEKSEKERYEDLFKKTKLKGKL